MRGHTVWNWIRWDNPVTYDDDENKWHVRSDNPAQAESVCGHKVPSLMEAYVEEFHSEFIPEDEHGVCLHCLRWRELHLRRGE